jgi:hypothetical protein
MVRFRKRAITTVLAAAISMTAMPATAQDQPPPSPHAEPSIASAAGRLSLPDVDGLAWQREYEGYGPTATESDIAPLEIETFVAAAEADLSRFGAHGADAHEASTDVRVGAYLAMRVAGADGEVIRHATEVWIAALLDLPEAPLEEATVGGRDVLVAEPTGMAPLYLLVEGDTVHLISTPEEVAVRILAALDRPS